MAIQSILDQLIIQGVGAYDAGSAVISEFLVFLPFILGRQYFRTTNDILEILRALVMAGLFYSLLLLFEIRMSPQLNNWIYGFRSTGFVNCSAFWGLPSRRFYDTRTSDRLLCYDIGSGSDSIVARETSCDASAQFRYCGLSGRSIGIVQIARSLGLRNRAGAIGALDVAQSSASNGCRSWL